jgi:NAD-dependent dihydropyrimidine dehydrogenase PreA subunit
MIVDVFRLRIPDLFIMDAVVGMEGNGPASPDLREIGLVLAADNGVAMDAVVAQMMGLDPAGLRFLEKARELGLGEFDTSALEIDGELTTIPDFKLPPLSGTTIASNQAIADMMQTKVQLRPEADPRLCSGCEACVEQCPVEALSMGEDIPEVDRESCIACFCCQEICPEKAITLQ